MAACQGQRQEMLRIEAEGRPAVLPDDPGVREHHAAAELVIDTLNKRHCQSAVIHDAHPDWYRPGLAAAPGEALASSMLSASGCRASGVSNCCTSTSRWRGSVICASRRANARLVASTIRCTVCASSASAMFRRSVMPADRQRHQSLRRRRKIPQRALLVLERQRRRTPGAVGLQVAEGDRHPQRGHTCARRSASGPR